MNTCGTCYAIYEGDRVTCPECGSMEVDNDS